MIKISVFYPHGEGATFDMDYYLSTHMPLVAKLTSPALKGMSVDGGVAGGVPGAPPAYIAIGHLLFESVEAFQGAFGPHTDEIMGDIPNYTAIEPLLQISEVKL